MRKAKPHNIFVGLAMTVLMVGCSGQENVNTNTSGGTGPAVGAGAPPRNSMNPPDSGAVGSADRSRDAILTDSPSGTPVGAPGRDALGGSGATSPALGDAGGTSTGVGSTGGTSGQGDTSGTGSDGSTTTPGGR